MDEPRVQAIMKAAWDLATLFSMRVGCVEFSDFSFLDSIAVSMDWGTLHTRTVHWRLRFRHKIG